MTPAGLEVVLGLGFGVFPCRDEYQDESHKDKAPLTDNGKNDATTDERQILEWSRQHPGCAWGARPPADVTVLDIDTKHGKNGFTTLAALEAQYKPLPVTLTNLTTTKGEHRIFRTAGGPIYKNRANVAPGLDVRSNGGYIIVPPSAIRAQHSTRRLPYVWRDPAQKVATAPDWLIIEIFAKEKTRDHRAPLQKGDRNEGLASYCGLLRAQAVEEGEARVALQRRNDQCEAPVSADELKAIFEGIYDRYPPGEMLVGVDQEVLDLIKAERPSSLILPNDNLQISYASERIFKQLGAGRELFMRSGVIVELRRDGSIDAVSKEELCSRIEGKGRRRILHAIKVNRGRAQPVTYALVPAQCSPTTAALLMAAPAAQALPELAVVSDCPLLIEHEGQLRLLGEGYHELGGGALIRAKELPPDVPLQEAVRSLLGLFEEFRFTAAPDRSRAVAQLMGPAFRLSGLLRGFATMSAVEAKEPQTGKGYLAKMMRVPYGAQAYDVVQRTGGVGSLDETIAQAILAGHPFIAFENMRGRLDSPFLEHALTSHERYAVRVPHKATVRVDVSRTMFQLTSNGVEATLDLVKRMTMVRLEKRPGEFKRYPEGDLLAHVEARASYYLGCIFAVVREWHRQGKQRLTTDHSFKDWIGTLDWIVQRVFELPPLMEGHDAALTRVANPGLSWLRKVVAAVIKRNWGGRELTTADLVEIGNSCDAPVSDSDDDQKHLLAAGRRLAQAFAGAADNTIVVEGERVNREQFTDGEGRVRWRYVVGTTPEM